MTKPLASTPIDWNEQLTPPVVSNMKLGGQGSHGGDYLFTAPAAIDVHALLTHEAQKSAPHPASDDVGSHYCKLSLRNASTGDVLATTKATNYRCLAISARLTIAGDYCLSVECAKGVGVVPAALSVRYSRADLGDAAPPVLVLGTAAPPTATPPPSAEPKRPAAKPAAKAKAAPVPPAAKKTAKKALAPAGPGGVMSRAAASMGGVAGMYAGLE